MAEEVKTAAAEGESGSKNFIDAFIEEDIAEGGRFQGQQVHTRFPPEPNGYLHIGHCKALTIDFGTAERFGGLCNLRMDDTNPTKEDVEFVDAIKEDIHWLGFDWGDRFFYGSDYFEKDYEYAVELIKKGLAYVCDLTPEQAREYRGDIGKPAISPYRDRDVEENLDLFERMKNGEFPEGSRTLRAKIDLASGNFNMRDPVIYRILHATHHRTGDKWCIYPLYDFAHPLSDALEGITHSICTLEFEERRPLYNWCLQAFDGKEKPRQIEFARLNVTTMITSKRKLRKMVEAGLVSGWDDPRMPTICGIRRRGYTPESLRHFCDLIGVAKADNLVDVSLLEYCIREDLKAKAPRIMAVIDPVKVVLTNYPEDKIEYMTLENNPEDESMGTRQVPFGRNLYIEREDFMEHPVHKFFRMTPGKEVRLKGAYIVKCEDVVKDGEENITEIHCTVDFDTRSGTPGADRKVKGTLHWVCADTAVDVETRLYDYLISPDDKDDGRDFMEKVNTNSLTVMKSKAEPAIKEYPVGSRFQFLRKGYFIIDQDTTKDHLVCNRIVGLRDTWAKLQKKQAKA